MSVRPSGKFFDRKHGSNRVTRPLFLVILCTIGMLLFSVLLFTRNFGLFFYTLFCTKFTPYNFPPRDDPRKLIIHQ